MDWKQEKPIKLIEETIVKDHIVTTLTCYKINVNRLIELSLYSEVSTW